MPATTTIQAKRPWIAHIDDERDIDNGIIATLAPGYTFAADPGCGVRGFDTMTEVQAGTRKQDVVKSQEAA